MCDPVSAGLMAGGAVLNRVQDARRTNRGIRAANNQAQLELGRQNQHIASARGNVDAALGDIIHPGVRLDDRSGERLARITTASQQLPAHGADLRSDAPKAIKDAFDRERADADGLVGERNHYLARAGALGDILTGMNTTIADTGSLNSEIGDTARRSSSLSALDQKTAFNNATRRPAVTLGDILQIGGAAYGGFAPKPVATTHPFTNNYWKMVNEAIR